MHLVVFVPKEFIPQAAAWVDRWVAVDADFVRHSAVDVRAVGGRWWDRRDYMLKGGNTEVCSRFNCGRFGKPHQGVIYGPRVRVSHSIGPAARKAAGLVTVADTAGAANGYPSAYNPHSAANRS